MWCANDLGRIAQPGDRRSFQICVSLEKYRTLLAVDVDGPTAEIGLLPWADVMVALFSLGIRGRVRPKVSSMKIIADIEETPREIYTGHYRAISLRMAVRSSMSPIRTALGREETRVRQFYGVGWVASFADSEPEQEYRGVA
ncbi:MAG: chorismate-binding protein [Candidatus Rariloculaceae bacterium]